VTAPQVCWESVSQSQKRRTLSTADHTIVRDVEHELRLIARDYGLTRTLEKRLVEIAQGLTNSQIAQRHGISNNTVKTQVRQLLRQLALGSRREIENAARAAAQRADNGASQQAIGAFLRLRFE